MDVMQLRRNLLMQIPGGGGLPAEYQQVEYITSTGGSYFDLPVLRFAANDVFRTIAKFQYLGAESNNFWLAGDGFSNAGIQYEYGKYGLVWWWGSDTFSGDTITYTETGTGVNSVIELDWEHVYTTASVSDYRFRVFQRAGFAAETTDRRFWMLKVYLNGTLLHDLVPCYRKSDNVVGMYDIVGNVFYTNAGAGSFVVPSKNLIPPFTNTDFWLRGYINTSGDFVSGESYRAFKDYMPISADNYYTISSAEVGWKGIAYYDENYQKIAFQEKANSTYIALQAPSTAKYAKAYFAVTATNVMMELGNTPSNYEPY